MKTIICLRDQLPNGQTKEVYIVSYSTEEGNVSAFSVGDKEDALCFDLKQDAPIIRGIGALALSQEFDPRDPLYTGLTLVLL